jgi:hypothetical protein
MWYKIIAELINLKGLVELQVFILRFNSEFGL